MQGTDLRSILFRITIDLCWILPLGQILNIAISGSNAPLLASGLILVLLYLPAVVLTLRDALDTRVMIYVLMVLIWMGYNAGALPNLMHLSSEQYAFLAGSLFFVGLLLQRSLAATTHPGRSPVLRDLFRGTLLTAGTLLYLHHTADVTVLWPVFVLPGAVVASAVSERVVRRETTGGTRLGSENRLVLILALLVFSLAISLLVTGTLAPVFWHVSIDAFTWLWEWIARTITTVAYPFIYVAFWLFNFVRARLPDSDGLAEIEPPTPPEFDDHLAETLPTADPVSLLVLRLLTTAVVVAGLILIFRMLRTRRALETSTHWQEYRESLWDPTTFFQSVAQRFSVKRKPAPNYRTETERAVRKIYERFLKRLPITRSPGETPQALARRVASLFIDAQRDVQALTQIYECVRYGPARENPEWVERARALHDKLQTHL